MALGNLFNVANSYLWGSTPFEYSVLEGGHDALITLISALIAILMVGLALLILHFLPRSHTSFVVAGTIMGLGIVLMHFVGMMGMQVCQPVNGLTDYLLSTVAAVILSILASGVAYDRRSNRNILFGTVCFAAAVVAVHYFAIWQTGFALADEDATGAGPVLSNQTLAMGVTVAAFLLCGAFLLTGVTFFELPGAGAPAPEQEPAPPAETASPVPEPPSSAEPIPTETGATVGVPYEKDGHTRFAPRAAIAAIRAEGHYTVLYSGGEKLFCPWSITDAESRLASAGFIRAHRSYLVNPAHVAEFTRAKDSGALFFSGADERLKVPVSRSRMGAVREALGL